jgi:beta-phosphoglucomutase
MQWLARLQRQSWRQAIATMAPRANLEVMVRMAGIQPYLDATVTAEDVARGKPEPDVFLAAADRLHIPPARCVVVEDAPAGVEAAHRAGMRAVGVGVKILPGTADRVVQSLTELPEDAFRQLVGQSKNSKPPSSI